MEAKECLEGQVDVLATGGYAGNVLMKSIEGTAMLMTNILKESLYMSLRTKIGAKLAMPALKNLKSLNRTFENTDTIISLELYEYLIKKYPKLECRPVFVGDLNEWRI